MKNIFLFIVLIFTILILVYKYKEGLQNYKKPIDRRTEPDENAFLKNMLIESKDVTKSVINDIDYFNNATNLIYGFGKIPDV